MSQILDTLPGSPLSVREITHATRSMWDESLADGSPASTDGKASQMNFILHFGVQTSVEEARANFDRALAFAQVYPCRLVVLLESAVPRGSIEQFEAKLYSQCFLDPHLRDHCCCDAIILAYPQGLASLAEPQVSLWLEADLPLYYWLHRIDPGEVQSHFRSLLKQARRVIFDRAIDGADFAALARDPKIVSGELAHARTLRLRQTLGQLLSAVPPEDLVTTLEEVRVCGDSTMAGEGAILLDWVREALKQCAARTRQKLECRFEFAPRTTENGPSLAMDWSFGSAEKSLHWEYSSASRSGHLKAQFEHTRLDQPLRIEPIDDAMLLAEAMFFG